MLSLCRRHSRNCKRKNHFSIKELGRCDCPLMVMGQDRRGIYHNREALHTRDVYTGQETIRQIEAGKIIRPQNPDELTIQKAWEKYREILITQRRLKPRSIEAVGVVERSMIRFADKEGKRYFREVDSAFLEKWIAEWGVKDSTMTTRRCFLSRMFDAAVKRKWIEEDPTLVLIRPRAMGAVGTTRPFDLDTELPKVMGALGNWETGIINKRKKRSVWAANPRVAEALIILLRLTGLRISDAFLFNPRSLEKRVVMGEEMYCYFVREQKKTDHPVFLPFYPDEVEPILKTKWLSEKYAFWDGETDLHEWTVRFHDNCLEYLERVSGVGNIHPHRFRDTFAVELLSKEMDIRTVSRLLGHKSISTTLRYYEHYIKADQDRTVERFMRAKRDQGKVVKIRA